MGTNSGLNEDGVIVEHVEMVLEKFDGNPEDGVLIERLFISDGEVTKHEFLEEGVVVRSYDHIQHEGGG